MERFTELPPASQVVEATWPRCDVEIRIAVDLRQLRWPSEGPLMYGHEMNLEFKDLKRPAWRTVRRVLAEEMESCRWVTDCFADGGDFDDAFREAEFDFSGGRARLDLAVAGAVLALNAAGYPTFYSCNGHQHGYPDIAFWTRRTQVTLLEDAARAAGVGLINGVNGCVEVFADQRNGLIRFGIEMAARGKRAITARNRPKAATGGRTQLAR